MPGKKYFYVFGDIFGFSQEYSFTAPPVASPNSTVRVVVYGGEHGLNLFITIKTFEYQLLLFKCELCYDGLNWYSALLYKMAV